MRHEGEAVLDVTHKPGFQLWEMQSPPANAISPRFLDAMTEHLQAAVADESVAVVILSSGLQLFSAGADAKWMSGIVKTEGATALLDQFNRTMDRFRQLCLNLRSAPVLFVAALNGHTLAGGLELAAACDIRFAANVDAIKLGVPEMELFGAMPSGGGGAQYLARLMGPSRALHFILDAKPISPARAFELGLVDRLCGPADLTADAEGFAADVARKAGRIGVAAAKRSVTNGVEIPLSAALELDRSLHWDSIRRGNFLTGVNAFVKQYG
jgi:enoyl-CoA hydratase